jgi:hypothetical protein
MWGDIAMIQKSASFSPARWQLRDCCEVKQLTQRLGAAFGRNQKVVRQKS